MRCARWFGGNGNGNGATDDAPGASALVAHIQKLGAEERTRLLEALGTVR